MTDRPHIDSELWPLHEGPEPSEEEVQDRTRRARKRLAAEAEVRRLTEQMEGR